MPSCNHAGNRGRGRRPGGIAASAVLLAALPCLSGLLQAQGAGGGTQKIIWYSYNGDHRAAGRWEIHLDGSYRPTLGSAARQWMVRPGVNAGLTDRVKLSLAYAYFDTHPNGLAEDEGESREHRLHQQVEYAQPWRRNAVRYRFRMEERWISSPQQRQAPVRWRWQDRTRYMLRLDRPVPLRLNGSAAVLTVYDEILFSFASPAASAFEQNRTYASLTWKLSQRLSLESGVMHQAVKTTAGPFRHNVIYLLMLRNSAPLAGLLRALRGS